MSRFLDIVGRVIMSRRFSVSWCMGIVNGDVSICRRVIRLGVVSTRGIVGRVIKAGIVNRGIVGCVIKSCRSAKKGVVVVVLIGRPVVW